MIKRKKTYIFIFAVLIIFPLYVFASKGALPDESQLCLGCHSAKGLNKQLENKEILSLYIDGNEFTKSSHVQMGCAGCHIDISMANHPQVKKIASKKDYSAKASKVCMMCHAAVQNDKQKFHTYMITKIKTVSCSECHGAHYIQKTKDWKKVISEIDYCLTCHKFSFSMALQNGELLSLYINGAAFKGSVHGRLSCSGCHPDFNKTKHPVRTFISKRDYTIAAYRNCSLCHTDQQLSKSPAHSAFVSKATCFECHGSHEIKPLVVQKGLIGEAQYCLSCHRSRLIKTMKNGEILSVYVDESMLRRSVHGNLKCNDCHTGFTKSQHPSRKYSSLREYSLISSELCKKCHADAYTKYETSIHYSLLKRSSVDAPSCIGCHGSHSVAKATVDRSFGVTLCNRCHSDMYASYKSSVHEEARTQGKPNTPTCASCHNAHDVESTRMTTKIKEGCRKCHTDIEKIHNSWLSNPPITLSTFAGTHFDVVSCAACHSPGAERVIYLSLFDRKTGKPLSDEELTELLNTDAAGLINKLDINGDGSIDSTELWNIFTQAFNRGKITIFIGKMDVSKTTEAHQIAAKKEAVRECEKCHHPEAEFFKNVLIVVNKADGKPMILNAKKDVINSVYTILPVSKFYALGSTNVKLFDILFIIALIGGIAVPIGHVSLRLITSPIRSLRRMGKGGKK